jgi:acyl-CoA thioesterase-2
MELVSLFEAGRLVTGCGCDTARSRVENKILFIGDPHYTGAMTELWPDLLGCLDLRPVPGEPCCFEGRNQRLNYHRLFGGQLLAQFVRAAALSCPGKAVKSVHALFPRAGQASEPVRNEVERQHSPVLAHGRCFGRGDVPAEDGSLVASYAQEAMVRFRPGWDGGNRTG